MAEFLGIQRESYARKERGEYQFKADEMYKIRSVFNLPLEQIFLPTDFEFLEHLNQNQSK
jgi:putative transcriptional regulator